MSQRFMFVGGSFEGKRAVAVTDDGTLPLALAVQGETYYRTTFTLGMVTAVLYHHSDLTHGQVWERMFKRW